MLVRFMQLFNKKNFSILVEAIENEPPKQILQNIWNKLRGIPPIHYEEKKILSDKKEAFSFIQKKQIKPTNNTPHKSDNLIVIQDKNISYQDKKLNAGKTYILKLSRLPAKSKTNINSNRIVIHYLTINDKGVYIIDGKDSFNTIEDVLINYFPQLHVFIMQKSNSDLSKSIKDLYPEVNIGLEWKTNSNTKIDKIKLGALNFLVCDKFTTTIHNRQIDVYKNKSQYIYEEKDYIRMAYPPITFIIDTVHNARLQLDIIRSIVQKCSYPDYTIVCDNEDLVDLISEKELNSLPIFFSTENQNYSSTKTISNKIDLNLLDIV